MGKEDLGIRGGLVGEKDDERRCVFSQDGTEGEVDLGETRSSAVASERMSQSHVWKEKATGQEAGKQKCGVETNARIRASAPY